MPGERRCCVRPIIELFVSGEPKGQPRVKAFCRGKHAGIYTPGTADNWKLQIAIAWDRVKPADFVQFDGPVELMLHFWMPRPKSHFGKHGIKESAPLAFNRKPDADNLAKAVMDQLTQCGVWKDDSQVCILTIKKRYTAPISDSVSGARIIIKELEPCLSGWPLSYLR